MEKKPAPDQIKKFLRRLRDLQSCWIDRFGDEPENTDIVQVIDWMQALTGNGTNPQI